MIQSTATAVGYARRTKEDSDAAPLASVVIMIATAVVAIRVLIESSSSRRASSRRS